jgi:quercetin dioxygenase-like cupin family protein
MKQILVVVAALAASITLAHAEDAAKVTSKPIFSSTTTVTGQPLTVPEHPKVTAVFATFPPGAALPVHKHPYPHYVYVLEGTLSVTNEETGRSFDVRQGEFFAEMQDTWHYGKNNGKVPVKLLVIDQLPPGVSSNVIPKGS